MAKPLFKLILRALGVVCFVIGCIGVLSPIPFGFVFLILSFLLLIPTTPWAAHAVRRARRRFDLFDRMMAEVIRRVPSPFRRILKETDVDILDRRY